MDDKEVFPQKYKGKSSINRGLLVFSVNQITVEIIILTPDIVRVRYSIDGYFEDDFSYAVYEDFKSTPTDFKLEESKSVLLINTGTFLINVDKRDLKLVFTDLAGNIINRDNKGFSCVENKEYGGCTVKVSKTIQEGEYFYGMGDKTTHLNLRGKRVTNWGMDTYGFKKGEDPIYKAIPFYLGLHHGRSYGIFLDNTFKSQFDFGTVDNAELVFKADGGEMRYYFINGPALTDVVKRYTQLTGVPEMPPMWTLGYHQSKWSYNTVAKVEEITSKMRSLEIPCDAIYLDIDYMDKFKCFTWDSKNFPSPEEMIENLKADGFKTVVIINPGIKEDASYDIFTEGLEKNYFCRRTDGDYFKGKVWPDSCFFPDFTHPEVREWWSNLFYDLVGKKGVKGIWVDMNEPALLETEGKTFTSDVRHNYDGHPCSHRKAHNIYGDQMAKATLKGVKRFDPNSRPFVISRSAFAGTQKYAASWTGDNIATWEHLWLALVQCQRMSVSGFSFIGSDIGGFIEIPTPELYIRWFQLAVFHPFFRKHNSGDYGDQEPWSFGEDTLKVVKEYIALRYRLLPYIYTAFYRYKNEYEPMISPISLIDQSDEETLYRTEEFMFGRDILISPVIVPGANEKYVYLPKGVWYDYWSHKKYGGNQEIIVKTPLDQIPMFIREGAVIPFYPVMQYVGEKEIEQLNLHVFYGENEKESTLYEDEGDGYGYRNGKCVFKKFITTHGKNSFHLTQEMEGYFQSSYNRYKFIIYGLPFTPTRVFVNGEENKNTILYFEKKQFVVVVKSSSFQSLDIF